MSQSPPPPSSQPSPNSSLGHPTHLIPNPPPQPPKICLDPIDLDFGTMDPNTSKTLQTSVSNVGGQQLYWSTGGGGLEVKPSKGTLDSNQSQSIDVTLNTGSVKLDSGPNTLLIRFNSSDGNFINLIVTVTLKEIPLKKPEWRALTGLGAYTSPSHPEHTEFQRGKTLWDLLTLLLLPLILTGGVIYFGMRQNQDNSNLTQNQFHVAATQYVNDKSIAATRYAEDQKLAQEQQVEANLQTYLDRISELLLNPSLHSNNQQGSNVRILATARTLTILQDLDGPHKATVLKFLHSAGLIGRQGSDTTIVDPIVNLNSADFSNADLTSFVLGGADLANVNFSGAILNGAYLKGAYLSGVILHKAQLIGANICSTQITAQGNSKPDLIGADLTNAHLGGANLLGANLNKAILKGTQFGSDDQTCAVSSGADLTNADLTGATEDTNTDFINVTWKNTTCPHGTKSDAYSPSSCVGH